MGKRMKNKPNIDYRHRWPTQQTLVESRATLIPRFKWRWKSQARWLRRLTRKSAPEPGKSTHPYDTGLGDSRNNSRSNSTVISALTRDDQRCLKLFSRTPQAATPPAPVIPKIPLIKEVLNEEPRPGTPQTPVQLLRQHLVSPKKSSPLPRSRNATPITDCDKPAVRCTHCSAQAQDLQLPKTVRPAAKSPRTLSTKIKSLAWEMFRRRRDMRRARS